MPHTAADFRMLARAHREHASDHRDDEELSRSHERLAEAYEDVAGHIEELDKLAPDPSSDQAPFQGPPVARQQR